MMLAVSLLSVSTTSVSASSHDVSNTRYSGTHRAALEALEALQDVNVFEGMKCDDNTSSVSASPDTDNDVNGTSVSDTDNIDDADNTMSYVHLCPNSALQRWEMAVWLVRILDRSNPSLADMDDGIRFTDVDSNNWWSAHVERLAELKVTQGCASEPLRFCPHDTVSRGQMAAFINRAFDLSEFEEENINQDGETAATEDEEAVESVRFIDVQDSHPFVDDINDVAAARITTGCSTSRRMYCPEKEVTYVQMVTFLARAAGILDLPEAWTYSPVSNSQLLPIDPDVHVGRLENGLTYYLQHNDTPEDALELRLVVKAGAVNETDDILGISHFIEHMLFNGTEDYPGNTILTQLSSIGAELGPDINAHVNADETVYKLSAEVASRENVNIMFHVLSQMASAALFDPEEVESEKGVVLDEMRLRYSPVHIEFNDVYTKGTSYEGRSTIGTEETIRSFTPEILRAYYSDWYVPENMALIVVGDWPVDELRSLLNEYFAPMDALEPPPLSLRDYEPDREPTTYVVTDPEQAYSYISLDIPIQRNSGATVGGQRLNIMELMISLMIQNRLQAAYHRGEISQVDPPKFETFDYNHLLRYYGTNWQGEKLLDASTDYWNVLLTAEKHGFTDNEMRRVAQQISASLLHQLKTAGNTSSATYLQRYESHFLDGANISSLTDRVAYIAEVMSDVTATDLTDHYRWIMDRAGPVVLAVGQDADSVPTTKELDAALASAAPGPQPDDSVKTIELMSTLPTPVEHVSKKSLENLIDTDFTGYEWSFENGVRVMFIQSDLEANQFRVGVQSLGGWSVLEPGDRALAARAIESVVNSGLGDLSALELQRFLEEQVVTVSPFIGETSQGFNATSSTNNTETLFQLIHMLVTAPRIDDRAFQNTLNTIRTRIASAETRPDWQAVLAYIEARFGSEWHWPVTTAEQLEALTPETLLSIYEDRLNDVGDVVVAIVGDIEPLEVEKMASRYLGTLPQGKVETYSNRRPAKPESLVQRQITAREETTAILRMYFEQAGEFSILKHAVASVLETALTEKLLLSIREALGSSYSVSASISATLAPEPTYTSTVTATLDPARFADIRQSVLEILTDISANSFQSEEFERAKTVVLTNYGRTTNAAMLNLLTRRLYLKDDELPTRAKMLAAINQVTLEDMQALAAELYNQESRIEVAQRPASVNTPISSN